MLSGNDQWFAVTLRFSGTGFNPKEIEGLLGLVPTSMIVSGEKWVGKNGREYGPIARHVWCHTLDAPGEAGFEEPIRRFLAKTREVSDFIRQLATRDEVDAELFCGFGSGNGQGGDTLSPETLQQIASLGLSLTLDLYPPDVDEKTEAGELIPFI